MDKQTLDKYILAGKIAASARDYGKNLCKPGVSVVEILDKIDNHIKEKGAVPAFPTQISINSVAAHFCPTENSTLKLEEKDIVKVDCGAAVDGYIADNAITVDLGNNTELVKASQEALSAALKLVRPGAIISEIGKAIHEVITSKGFSPIKNLSGHGLAQWEVHNSPTIPNFDTGDQNELEEDDVIAIEPFASTGAGVVYESRDPTLFSLINEKPVRSQMTREVLKEIKSYNGLPFTTRWLNKKFGVGKTSFALRELKNNEMLDEHPPLIDKGKGIVSQAEHSVIVKNKPIIFTKIDD